MSRLYVPRVNLNPELESYAAEINLRLQSELTPAKASSFARNEYYHFISENAFDNADYDKVFAFTAACADMLYQNSQNSMAICIDDAVSRVAKGQVANHAYNTDGIWRDLRDDERAAVEAVRSQYLTVIDDLRRYADLNARDAHHRDRDSRGGQEYSTRNARDSRDSGREQYRDPRGRDSVRYDDRGRNQASTGRDRDVRPARHEHTPVSTRHDRGRPTPPQPVQVPIVQPAPITPVTVTQPAVVSTSSRPVMLQLTRGVEDQCNIAEVFPGVQWNTRACAFDVESEIAFITLTDKGWEHIYRKREGHDVNYKSHETEHLLRQVNPALKNHKPRRTYLDKALQSATQVKSISERLVEYKLANSHVEAADDSLIPISQTAVQLDLPVICCTDHDYFSGAIDVATRSGAIIDHETTAVNYTAIEFLQWRLGDAAHLELIAAFQTCESLQAIMEQMCVLADQIPSTYWRHLDEMLAHQVNDLSVYKYGMTLTIESFCMEIDELLVAIAEDYSAEVSTEFNANVAWIKETTLKLHQGETYADAANLDPEDPNRTLVGGFGIVKDVTLLPVHSKDVGIGYYGDSGLVSSSRTPKLYNLIRDRFAVIGDTVRHVVLVTTDGGVIECHRTNSATSYAISRP